MTLIELLLISVGLAMDTFAVSICKGLSMTKINFKKAVIVGLYFGGFQALMPLIGYLFGSTFSNLISNIDHWAAFILLSLIGANMIKEAFSKDDKIYSDNLNFKNMLILSIATSIDALTIGITFSFLEVNILFAVLSIGIITIELSILGVFIGKKFGNKFESKAKILGGLILILLGMKILIEHLNIF